MKFSFLAINFLSHYNLVINYVFEGAAKMIKNSPEYIYIYHLRFLEVGQNISFLNGIFHKVQR